MDGLRRLVQADNRSAVDVGDLRRGTRSLKVQKLQFSEAFPEAVIREGADELALRSDEVGTQRASSTQSTFSSKGGGRRWLMRTGMLSSKQSTLEGKIGKSCIVTTEK